jgi:hypothetical protein
MKIELSITVVPNESLTQSDLERVPVEAAAEGLSVEAFVCRALKVALGASKSVKAEALEVESACLVPAA